MNKNCLKLLSTLPITGLLMYPSLCSSADREKIPLPAFIGMYLGVYVLGAERVPGIHCHSNTVT